LQAKTAQKRTAVVPEAEYPRVKSSLNPYFRRISGEFSLELGPASTGFSTRLIIFAVYVHFFLATIEHSSYCFLSTVHVHCGAIQSSRRSKAAQAISP
jgi:hypothetical protein